MILLAVGLIVLTCLIQGIANTITARIANGILATNGQFPYVVSLHDDREKLVCTGTLFTVEKVVTAGHCIYEYDLVHIYAGDVDGYATGTNENRQMRGVKKTYVKNTAGDSSVTYHVDVGVIELDSPFEENSNVRSLREIEYPVHDMHIQLYGFAIGFGSQTDIPEVKPDGHLRWQHYVLTGYADECVLNNFSLCAIGQENAKMGRFDDGGPLMSIEQTKRKAQLYFNGIYVFRRDDNDGYDVFMDVFKLMDWFKNPEDKRDTKRGKRSATKSDKNQATSNPFETYMMAMSTIIYFTIN